MPAILGTVLKFQIIVTGSRLVQEGLLDKFIFHNMDFKREHRICCGAFPLRS